MPISRESRAALRTRILAINEEITKFRGILEPIRAQKRSATERVDQIQAAIDALEAEKSELQADIDS